MGNIIMSALWLMKCLLMLSRARLFSTRGPARHCRTRRIMVTEAGTSVQSTDCDDDKRKRLEHMSDKFAETFKVPEKTPQQVFKSITNGESVVVVDCRNADEQDVSMINGAVRQSELDLSSIQGHPVVCYCTVGYRSSNTVKDLLKKGVDSYNLRGSIMAWTWEQYPLVDGKDPSKPSKTVHSYSSSWALQGHGYTATSYSWPAIRMAKDAVSSILPTF